MKTLVVGMGVLGLLFAGGLTIRAFACGEGCNCNKDKAVAESKVGDLSTADLKKAMADGALVFDSRKAEDFKAGHIPGAKSLPVAEVSDKTLGGKKDQALVFYCGGIKCPLCKQAAAKAVELSYTNVKTYTKGIAGWQADGEKVAKD